MISLILIQLLKSRLLNFDLDLFHLLFFLILIQSNRTKPTQDIIDPDKITAG